MTRAALPPPAAHRAPARAARAAVLAAAVLLALAPTVPAAPEDEAKPGVELQGLLRGARLTPPRYFRWSGSEEARGGILGALEGSTREFEQIRVEFGADRSVMTAPLRAGFEGFRYRNEVERGEPVDVDAKPDAVVVRLKSPFRQGVHASAVRAVGRTVVFARGSAERRQDEAALVALLRAVVAGVASDADEVDGWIPREVKARWTRADAPDLRLVHDATLDEERLAEVAKAARVGFGAVRRSVPGAWAVAGPPIVRATANRDMFDYLAGRRDARQDALHLPWAAEVLVSPRGERVDAGRVAAECAALALQHALGGGGAEPLLTGLARAAAAQAEGASPGAFAPADAERALARAAAGEATTWYRTLMRPTLVNFLAEDAEGRALDAQLAVHYLDAPGSVVGRASLAAYAAAFRKWAHPDAAAEAAVGATDGEKCDAEWAAHWKAQVEGPKKPGKNGGKAAKPSR